MKNDLNSFVEISRFIGSNPLWVQGPGGNVSVKTDDGKMIVKGSGSELFEVSESKGYTEVAYIDFMRSLDSLILRDMDPMEREVLYSELVSASNLDVNRFPRPSMELGFHALLPHKYVMHYHSVASVAASDMKFKNRQLPSFSSDCDVHFEPFHLPGFSICPSIKRIVESSASDIVVVFLRNHGIIVATSEDPFRVLEMVASWEGLFWRSFFSGDYFNLKREELYAQARQCPVVLRHIFPDSVMLENRVHAVVDFDPDSGAALQMNPTDTAAADLFAVYSLLVRTVSDIATLSDSDVNAVRNMPIEMARMKQMMKGEK